MTSKKSTDQSQPSESNRGRTRDSSQPPSSQRPTSGYGHDSSLEKSERTTTVGFSPAPPAPPAPPKSR